MHLLYQLQTSGNCYKARMLMALLGVPFRVFDVDIFNGETQTSIFLQKNPTGMVPVLEMPNGFTLAESNAILFYLAEGTGYLPSNRFLRAQVLRWMFFEQYSHEPNIAAARFWCAFVPDGAEKMEHRLSEWMKLGHMALQVMEKHLQVNSFFVGQRYSIADISLYAYTHVAYEGGFELDDYPAIQDWLDRISAIPGHVPITWRPNK